MEQVTWDQVVESLIPKGSTFIRDTNIFDIMGVNM